MMSSNEAKNAFQTAENHGDAARKRIGKLLEKPDVDQDTLEVLNELAVAIRELARGMREMAK